MSESLSIIVPVYNEEQSILARIEYFRKLADNNQLIFVDGGSSDNTVELLRAHGQFVYEESLPNRGSQLFAGARQAKQDVLLFHHFDSVLPEDYQALLARAIESHCWGRFDIRLSGLSRILRIIEWSMNLRSRLTGIVTGDQVMFIRKDIFFQCAEGIQEHPLMEDIFLSKQLKRIEPPHRIKKSVISSSRYWEQHGAMNAIVKMWILRLLYYFGISPGTLYKMYYK